MIIKFCGMVDLGDGYRCGIDDLEGYIYIGGRDFLWEVSMANFRNPVTIAIAEERFTGDLICDFGYGYSEYTPMDSDKMTIGKHNILNILSGQKGKRVTVWVSDEPINTLGDYEEEPKCQS